MQCLNMTMARNTDLKNENEKMIRAVLYSGLDYSAADLEEISGLSHGTVMNLLREFLERNEILLCEKRGNAIGRKTYRYRINPDSRRMCTVSIRRKQQGLYGTVSLRNLEGECLDTVETETFMEDVSGIRPSLDAMIQKHPDTDLIVVSTPGVCRSGVISLPTKQPYDLGTAITDTWNIPYVIENDVNVATIGFQYSSADIDHMALIYQGGGRIIGCGIIIDGKLYNGASHAAGELRWVPFMRDIENRSDAQLLKDQILSAAAVLNPQVIAWYSDCVQEEITLTEEELPLTQQPILFQISDLDELIEKGMHSIGMHVFIENRGGTGK